MDLEEATVLKYSRILVRRCSGRWLASIEVGRWVEGVKWQVRASAEPERNNILN